MKLENTVSGFHKNTHTQMVGCGLGVRNGDKSERKTEGVRSEKYSPSAGEKSGPAAKPAFLCASRHLVGTGLPAPWTQDILGGLGCGCCLAGHWSRGDREGWLGLVVGLAPRSRVVRVQTGLPCSQGGLPTSGELQVDGS